MLAWCGCVSAAQAQTKHTTGAPLVAVADGRGSLQMEMEGRGQIVPLKETAPMLMEGEARDFVPARDLQILFVAE